MDRWSGKIALVTGAGSGIGAAVTEELTKNGINVFALDISIERVEEVKQKIGQVKGEIIPLQGDVRNQDDIVSAFNAIREKFGVIHILVNNAGILRHGFISDGNIDHFQDVMDINFMGYVRCIQQALKLMKENGVDDGHIININSISGHKVVDTPGMNVYAPSKFAVTALTETIRKEMTLLKTKIKVTSISPGPVETKIFSTAVAAGGISSDDLLRMSNIKDKLLCLKPKDIADAILYVLSTPPHVQISEITIVATGLEL